MKKIVTFLATVFITLTAVAQVPQKMSYQAVIRNSSNALVSNAPVGMQISILQNSATGTAVYVETQVTSTNSNGLVSIEIGSGTPVTGTFSGIDWSMGPYFIKTETDPTGGTSYTISSTNQLLSVPFALYAEKAGNATPGVDGKTILNGAVDPVGATGTDGDFYLNTATNKLYGPKTSG
ncbi:MAG TPA: hypothetical protein VLB84_19660, partial [Bacteroidia bacterium]|nr:hypothetical protein [Bacteroidia bacterium]